MKGLIVSAVTSALLSVGCSIPFETRDVEWVKVSAGPRHSCGVSAEGELVCWGCREYQHSLLDLAHVDCGEPGIGFVDVAAGADHTCGLEDDGTVVCWGCDPFDTSGKCAPPDGSFVDIVTDHNHTCALRDDGGIECWGCQSSSDTDPDGEACLSRDGSFIQLATESYNGQRTCALGEDGTVQCWPSLDDDDLPADTAFAHVATECVLADGSGVTCWWGCDQPANMGWTEMSVGECWAVGLDASGELSQWTDDWAFDDPFPEPPSGAYVAVDASNEHACAIDTEGQLICWGNDPDDTGKLEVPR